MARVLAWAAALAAAESVVSPSATPVTLLSGFLGAGKTTCLSHILKEAQGLRLGVVVNDVARLNIDADLISQAAPDRDVVRLQNGCACCSISDELTDALAKLGSAGEFDHIVVELSGVAEPELVRANFKAALKANPALGVRLERVVSLVDSSTFLSYFDTAAPLGQRSQLRELTANGAPADECADNQVVSQLLVGQVDAADVLLLNKRDLVSETEMGLVRKLLASLNPTARLLTCERGAVGVRELLHGEEEEGEGGARQPGAVEGCDESGCADPSHEHSHGKDHSYGHAHSEGHEHSDAHEHSHDGGCADATCTDPSHDHSHQSASAVAACSDPDCTDPTHAHPPANGKPSVVDKFGIHSFIYSARRPFEATRLAALMHQWPLDRRSPLESARIEMGLVAEDSTGSAPPVYAASASIAPPGAPPLRFSIGERVQCNVGAWKGGRVTQHWYSEDMFDGSAPYQVLLDDGTYIFAPVDVDACIRAEPKEVVEASPFRGVLRSKGWCWLSARPRVAGFWSHAGKHVEVTSAGEWWAAVGDDAMRAQLTDSDYEATVAADFEGEWGDCRQEIVFIGTQAMREPVIRSALDGCLVSEAEMRDVRRAWEEEEELTVSSTGGRGGGSYGPRPRVPPPRMAVGAEAGRSRDTASAVPRRPTGLRGALLPPRKS
jgi:G3E family GTPase